MLQVNSLEKHFGERVLFSDATLTVAPGERVALFGRNGSGKSTLLKIIAGEESPDRGDVSTPRGYRIGYLKQHISFSAPTVIEEACTALADPDSERYKAEIVLEGLGFTPAELELSPTALSGGFQIRINLAKLILSEPNLLLLDEPTNYLDIVSLRWLERYLRSWPGEMIVISHDRAFCDFVSSHSALIYRSGIRKLEGNSEKLFARIAEDEEIYEKTRQSREKEIKRMEAFINRFRAKASKATVVQSRVKALEKIERLDELSEDATLDFSFVYSEFPGRFPLEIKGLSFGFTGMDRPLIDDLNIAVGKKDRIAVIGKNGRGKSTFLKLLAGELQPVSGEIVVSPNTRASFFAQTNTNTLNLGNTIETEIHLTNTKLSRTAVRAICGCMMFEGDDALKKISVLSGGERSRVVLGKILATPSNMLLLDEPTNHLDVESVESLTDALERFDGAVFIVTHSEEILRRLATRLIVFQGDAPFVFEGTYADFLERVGWDEEQGVDPSTSVRKNKKNKGTGKEVKKEKAELLQERSRLLTPLRKEIERCEERITSLEQQISNSTTRLADVSEKGDAAMIRTITHELAELKRELDAVMTSWESASERATSIEKEFDVKPKTWTKSLAYPISLLLSLPIGLTACVGSFFGGVEEEAIPVSYQLYLSGETGSGVEFEQYRSLPRGVFVECGSLEEGRAQPNEQGISPLSAEQEALIGEKVREVSEQSGEDSAFTFDPPSGPNQVVLSLKVDARVVEIRTSLDSLARAESDSAIALRGLLEAVRGLPPQVPCGHEVFAQIVRHGDNEREKALL